MNALLKNLLIIVSAGLVISSSLSSCKKKAFDEYYSRPDTLAAPIYQQLDAKGNFKSLLACIDKAGYKSILSAAGYWTFFAPNDKAFEQFFIDKGISGVSQIDSTTAQQLVGYCLVYNAFSKVRLADYQSATGYIANQAFRRRTAYYTGFYNDTTLTGQKVKAVESNRNGAFILGDNNNKYIPYFLDNFMTAKGISSVDYNYFYPNTIYKGFNVANATVVTPDIFAENGYIHEIDKVILPLKSIDQYLAIKPEYSEFKKLFDKYMVNFVQNASATDRYKNITGLNDLIFVKTYNFSLAFSPNNENYKKDQDNDGQKDSWTLFAPRNDVFIKYRDSVLLENYPNLDVVPQQIIIDFLNAHMWQTAVWPTRFANTNNVQAEPARFNPATDVIDKQILSNGNFYGTSKVQDANVFRTVYGKPYLDPKYLLMTRALDQSLRFTITIPTLYYTVFMMSDVLLRAKGYDYNVNQSAWQYTAPGTTTTTIGNAARDRLQRLLANHIIPTTATDEMRNLSGNGIIENLGGEYIKWSAGKLGSAGTNGIYNVTAGLSKAAFNGRVYYSDSLLDYSDTLIGATVRQLGAASTSPFNYFYQYLFNSPIYTAATGSILGVDLGVFYTLFIPNNTAIQAAVTAGALPRNTNGTPNFAPNTQGGRDTVANFIKFH
ncbi:MAG: fasciclin domain-containing protein, partial [Pedobacter sp.]|nr:fasciclin domain-containing protein [Chitinophagaceae bacterium]